MAVRGLVVGATLICAMVVICYGEVKLSELSITLSRAEHGSKRADLLARVGKITVTWALNKSNADTSKYSKVTFKLCYTKASQIDRPWRKTEDELFKDKTCQHEIATKTYTSSENSVDYVVLKDVPTGHYFIRAYVVDAAGTKVAYGQIDGVDLFITAITGRHVSIDIAAATFSAFSIVSLAFFFYLEKKKSK
ncbi:hypothetical protein RND81_04G106100 [Saponaria officinalis]|uniref:High-affinity nitrate transporter n=1 Tax=Saponaria officinalis TaxID=3572 RepID=A0AAW1LMW3_SAPOF